MTVLIVLSFALSQIIANATVHAAGEVGFVQCLSRPMQINVFGDMLSIGLSLPPAIPGVSKRISSCHPRKTEGTCELNNQVVIEESTMFHHEQGVTVVH